MRFSKTASDSMELDNVWVCVKRISRQKSQRTHASKSSSHRCRYHVAFATVHLLKPSICETLQIAGTEHSFVPAETMQDKFVSDYMGALPLTRIHFLSKRGLLIKSSLMQDMQYLTTCSATGDCTKEKWLASSMAMRCHVSAKVSRTSSERYSTLL